MEVNREKYSIEEMEAEQKQIEEGYLQLRFAQKSRKDALACYRRGG